MDRNRDNVLTYVLIFCIIITGIEGIELTVEEVCQIMQSPAKKPVLPPNRSREEQEARNAQKVMFYVVKELTLDPGIPLTEKLVRAIHRITTKDIDYPNNTPGKYRSHDVSVGTYVPPSGGDVSKLMREFIKWFNTGAPVAWDPNYNAIGDFNDDGYIDFFDFINFADVYGS